MPSDAMENLSYKELQNIAMILNIPANLKTSRLLQVIEARRAGDESRVERLLSEHRDQRKSSRGKCAPNPKRRKVLPTHRMRDYVYQQVPTACESENTDSHSIKDKVLSGDQALNPFIEKQRVSSPESSKIPTYQNQQITIASPPTINPLYCQAHMQLSECRQQREYVYNHFESYSALPNDQVPTSLELIMNIRPQTLHQKSSCAVTVPSYCYIGCISSSMLFPHNEVKNHPSPPEDTWSSSNNIGPSPNFRQNDQISYPLIYSYLASTEEQLLQQKFPQRLLMHGQSNWIPSEPSNNITEVPELEDINIQESSNSHIHKTILNVNKEEIKKGKADGTGRQETSENNEGGETSYNEAKAEGLPEDAIKINCPQDDCQWSGRLRMLAAHLRNEHGETIVSGTETSHTITLKELMIQKHLYFLQEASKRLFIASIHCEGNLMYVTIQSIPSGRSGLSHGTLEIVGNDGQPYSWRGHIRSCHEPLKGLWAKKNCLLVDLAVLGTSTESSITLHCSISIHVPSTVNKFQRHKRSR